MNIAIITAGVLPVPPTSGGAVENLVYTLINENEKVINPIQIDIYSIPCSENGYIGQKNTTYYFNEYSWLEKNIIYRNKVLNKILNKLNLSNYILFLKNALKNKKYDYIIIENRPQYVKILRKVNNSKIILHMHNDHMIKNPKKGIEVAKNCHKIVVVSQYIKNSIINNLNISEDKIVVLHNGIDTKRFCEGSVSKENKSKIRSELKISDNDFIVLFSGRIIKEKGILEVIEAVKKLNTINNLKLLIVGSTWYGANSKSKFTEEIKEISFEIKEKIIFTGYIKYEEINNIYSIADLIVLPSMWDDPFPLTVLEAMSMGIPVITTVSGGIPEMFEGNDGILLERNEEITDKLADVIEKLYEDSQTRKVMGQNARKRVEERFSNERFYKNFISILE